MNLSPHKRRISILGSTGSVGTQALQVIDLHPDQFQVEVLTAAKNASQLIQQAIQYQPRAVAICDEAQYPQVRAALSEYPIKVLSGPDCLEEAAAWEGTDLLLAAIVGVAGLKPVLAAIRKGIPIALANKECLVVAGDLVMEAARASNVAIIPVDSEHSAIFQCLAGEQFNRIEKIILTASGGPFLGKKPNFLINVKKAHALQHPNWNMGEKITIDSATLMNKGLEMIEAKWLFDLAPEQIEVVIHPQSVIHSMVQFEDGSIKAQMGLPDMRFPIQYALSYPRRLVNNFPRFRFKNYPAFNFEQPDTKTFRNLAIATETLLRGGNAPCVMNAANEEVVQAFLKNRIGFLDMTEIIEKTLVKIPFISKPNLQEYQDTDWASRELALSMIRVFS